jgi:hypothetical protein
MLRVIAVIVAGHRSADGSRAGWQLLMDFSFSKEGRVFVPGVSLVFGG